MKIAVLKISGKALNELFASEAWIQSIQKLNHFYDGLVIVHGAGKNISEWSEALGHQSKFIDGQRVTTEEVMDVVAAVQAGILNAKIVSKLISSGLNAIGLTGIDRGSFVAENVNEELGFVGVPKQVQSINWIKDLAKTKVIPVFSSVCRDAAGNLMNVNADIFTEVLAASLKAESVFFVSDVQGVMLNGNFQQTIDAEDILKGINEGEITDGMIPKMNSCLDLLNKGINKIWIGSKILEDIIGEKKVSGGTWIVQSA
ncbi:MAG: acetylglutamate kinase [Ignavibacteriales bacterium]|nr:acetylglutamate kinase [Ignavibacteriales bacterium]